MAAIYTHFGTPDEVILLIGKLAIESASMDTLLGKILGAHRGLTELQIAKDIMGSDTRSKINALRSELPKGSLDDVLSNAADILADRNLAVHGIGMISPSSEKVDSTVVFRGRFKGNPQPRTAVFFEAMLKKLGEINGELLKYGTTVPPLISFIRARDD